MTAKLKTSPSFIFEQFASFWKLRIIQFSFGRVAEWLNAPVLKTGDERSSSVGSNPTSSANIISIPRFLDFSSFSKALLFRFANLFLRYLTT